MAGYRALEKGFDHPRAALEHAIRDPAIAQHHGWRRDAQAAVEELDRLRDERQAVLDCINLYGDQTLHSALDAIGWPTDASPRKDQN